MKIYTLIRTTVLMMLAMVLALTATVGSSATASAATTSVSTAPNSAQAPQTVAPTTVAGLNPMISGWCGDGRCAIYLTKYETWLMGQGRVPSVPWFVPWQLRAAYYGLAYGHRWFAQQYANRGWCSGFRLDIRPWASQGYFGYSC